MFHSIISVSIWESLLSESVRGKIDRYLSFERNYETTITGVEELEENKFILLYGAGPAIASYHS
jgi:hypothetical protein